MIESEKLVDGGGISPTEGKRLALVVGVNGSIKSNYRDPLRYAEYDAYEMAKALASSACNFTVQPVLQGKGATTRNIQDAIIELIQECTHQDFLCFYFSGHAQPMKVRGERQDIYLVTHDFCELQVEIAPAHHLSMRWLWEVMYQRTNVGNVLLILDCCYAGNMVATGPDRLDQLLKNDVEREDDTRQTDRSRFILCATGRGAVAHERDGHGVMTGLLLKALRGEDTSAYDKEGFLDASALYVYLLKEMSDQPPSRSVEGRDRFLLAWYSPIGGQAGEAPMVTTTGVDFWKRLEETLRKTHALPFDHTLCRDASLTDINMEAVAGLLQRERVQKEPGFHSSLTNKQEELLEYFDLLQEAFLTYGALLCFGRNPSKWIAGAFARCTFWKGDGRLDGWEEDQYFRGNLLKQYESSIEFLQRGLRLGRVISAEGSVERWEVPFVALREALANALIHREYADQTNYVRVEIFDDRIEISSPGGLPDGLTIEQLGRKTYYRNLQIARMFYLCNYVEEAGTGINRMQRAMQEAQLPPPQFANDGGTFTVVLRRPQRARFHETGEQQVFADSERASGTGIQSGGGSLSGLSLMEPEVRARVFISCAPEDQELCRELEDHLRPLEHSGKISIWQDHDIPAGANQDEQINTYLEQADVILLSVSASFMASPYCWNQVVRVALERHKAGTARVIPILLRPVRWQDTPLGQLQAFPTGAKAVTLWDDQDTAFDDVVQGIGNVVENLRIKRREREMELQKEVQQKEEVRELKKKMGKNLHFAYDILEKEVEGISNAGSVQVEDIKSASSQQAELPLMLRQRPDLGKKRWVPLLSTLIAIVLLLSIFVPQVIHLNVSNGIGVTSVEGEDIGISDGRYALDISRENNDAVALKIEASKSLRNGNRDKALAKWNEAHEKDTSDAETLIYAENQRVLASGSPYMTIVLGVSLGVKIDDGFSRSALQGAYIAQKECNENPDLSGGKKLRFLIARSGSNPDRSEDVAKQIVQAARFDKTIVGVQGWTTSAMTLKAARILADAHLPFVASNAMSDELTSISPYFFRVSASNMVQTSLITTYIEKQLKSQRLIIFRDPDETYSLTLSRDLAEQFAKDGYQIASIEDFKTADEVGLTQRVQKALTTYKPDLLYIPTNAVGDVTTVLNNIPATAEYADLKVFTSGAGYELVQDKKKPNGYGRMLFSVSAFPDGWSMLSGGKPVPPFFRDYPAVYDPHSQHYDFPYTYRRANANVMLTYDALYAFLVGSRMAVQQGKPNPTPEDLKNALSQINGSQSFQGITGATSFGSDGNPINKVHFVVHVVEGKYNRVAAYRGCFLVGSACDNDIHILE